jgi:hypothetical protein
MRSFGWFPLSRTMSGVLWSVSGVRREVDAHLSRANYNKIIIIMMEILV